MSLLLKNCSFVEVTYLVITFNSTKSFQWNTTNSDRNDVNEQNTHSIHRKITSARVSYGC